MVLTVTLNPCIDMTIYVNNFQAGELNRSVDSREDVGGKGINVSLVLNNLGIKTMCTGLNYSYNGNKLTDLLNNYSIKHDFIEVNGKIRTNHKIFDLQTREMTELNALGGRVFETDIKHVVNNIYSLVKENDLVVLGGSAPQGVCTKIYQEIICKLKDKKVKIILDADGDLLKYGLMATPYAIKPNIKELEQLYSTKFNSNTEIVEVAKKLIETGIEIVLVSLGKDGAIIVNKDEAYFAKPLKVQVKGLQGAGDSMVAGICKGIVDTADLKEILINSVAAASGTVSKDGTILCDKSTFTNLLKDATGNIEKIY